MKEEYYVVMALVPEENSIAPFPYWTHIEKAGVDDDDPTGYDCTLDQAETIYDVFQRAGEVVKLVKVSKEVVKVTPLMPSPGLT